MFFVEYIDPNFFLSHFLSICCCFFFFLFSVIFILLFISFISFEIRIYRTAWFRSLCTLLRAYVSICVNACAYMYLCMSVCAKCLFRKNSYGYAVWYHFSFETKDMKIYNTAWHFNEKRTHRAIDKLYLNMCIYIFFKYVCAAYTIPWFYSLNKTRCIFVEAQSLRQSICVLDP